MDASEQAEILDDLDQETEEPPPKRQRKSVQTEDTKATNQRNYLISHLRSILRRNPDVELDLTEGPTFQLKQLTTDELENALDNLLQKIGQSQKTHQTALSVLSTVGSTLKLFGGKRFQDVGKNMINDDALIAAVDILLPSIFDAYAPQLIALDRLAHHLAVNQPPQGFNFSMPPPEPIPLPTDKGKEEAKK
jgi:hypothetical protein